MSLLAILVGLLFGYSLVSRRLEGTILTGPMLFTAAGVAMALAVPGELAIAIHSQILLYPAEIGLVLLLFTAAGSIDLSMLWNTRALPARLLGIGLPLTIVLGTAIACLIFPNLSLWEAAVLSAILAPTDAGLGQVVLTSPRVPLRLRQALNVETGLNDGLAVPFMLFFIALAAASDGDATVPPLSQRWPRLRIRRIRGWMWEAPRNAADIKSFQAGRASGLGRVVLAGVRRNSCQRFHRRVRGWTGSAGGIRGRWHP